MKIVLDTNVFYVSISSRSPFHWVFRILLEQKYTLCVTFDILDEYAEIIERFFSPEVAENVLKVLDYLPNVEYYEKYYQWGLITADYDDNKFVDCAIAANAHYIVTNDKHFDVLQSIDFPKVEVLNSDDFKKIISP